MTNILDETATTRPPMNRQKAWELLGRYGTLVMLGLLIIVVASLEPENFLTPSNFISILNQSALAAVIGIGLTFALVCGEFDLSIGNTASLAGVLAATLMLNQGISFLTAVLVAVLVGAIIGLVNGLIVTKLNVHALVGTLGVGTIAVGINYAVAGGVPVSVSDPDALLSFSLGKFLGVPYPVYVMAAVAIIAWLILNRTVLGQSMQAVGGNPIAAELSGIRVERVKLIGFVLCGVLAGLTGILLVTRTGSAAVSAGDTYLLSAFAAAFFGSAVLRDGQFHIIGTLVGVVTVAVGFNSIALIGLETFYQYLFQGLILIIGVGVGSVARRRALQ